MEESIKGFSHVEYLAIFLALVFAFVVAEFFEGWSNMLKKRDQYIPYWEHTSWSIVLFISLIINWFLVWPRLQHIDKSMVIFFLLLLPALVFKIAGDFVFPKLVDKIDLKLYLDKKTGVLFGILGFYAFLQIFIDFILQVEVLLYVTIFRIILMIWTLIVAFTGHSGLRKSLLLVSVFMIIYVFFKGFQLLFEHQ
jgi:hypothetical protein